MQALARLKSLKADHDWDCLFPVIQALTLGGAGQIEISFTAQQWRVAGTFERAQVLAGECPLLGNGGWSPALRGEWLAILENSTDALRDLCLATWMACQGQSGGCTLQWRSGSHSERLSFTADAPPRRRATPLLDFEKEDIQVTFLGGGPVVAPEQALQALHHRCHWSTIPIYAPPPMAGCNDGDLRMQINGTEMYGAFSNVDPRWCLPAGYGLVERFINVPRLGGGGPANLTQYVDGKGFKTEQLSMDLAPTFLREIVEEPHSCPTFLRVELASNEIEKLNVIRGGVILDEIAVSWGGCGAQVYCSDEGLNLDTLGLRVMLDETLGQRIRLARQQVRQALLHAQAELTHLVPWEHDALRENAESSAMVLFNVAGALIGTDLQGLSARHHQPCRDPQKIANAHRELDNYLQGSLDLLDRDFP